MAINVAEITGILKREIAGFDQKLQINEVGTVIEVGDGIARVYGLRNAMSGELLEFENGVMGQVFNLEEDSIGAVISATICRSRKAARSRAPVVCSKSPSVKRSSAAW